VPVDGIQRRQRRGRVPVDPEPQPGLFDARQEFVRESPLLPGPLAAAADRLQRFLAAARGDQHARPDDRMQRRVVQAARPDRLIQLDCLLYPPGVRQGLDQPRLGVCLDPAHRLEAGQYLAQASP